MRCTHRTHSGSLAAAALTAAHCDHRTYFESAGLSLEAGSKIFETASHVTLAGIVLMFCKWYHIFSRSTATVLTATFVFLMIIAPGLAAKEVFGFQAPEPDLPSYLATVKNNPSGHLWHAVFSDAGPGCMYLTAWLLMPKENRAALLGWVVGRGAK